MDSSPNEDNSPSASFQKLCQNMLNGSSRNLTKKNVEDFRVILHMIMHECSKTNIETGKHWVFDNCHSPAHVTALMDYIYTLSKSRSGQDERIHMLYLINDVVFHIARKKLTWMRDAILPLLTPFLKLVYDTATTPEYKAKVTKVINFWYTKSIFQSNIIDAIKMNVEGEPTQPQFDKPAQLFHHSLPPPQTHHQQPYMQQQIHMQQPHLQQPHLQNPHVQQQQPSRIPPATPTQQCHLPGPPQMTMIEKPYYEMPAGLMLLTKSNSYEPLDPAMIKNPYPRPPPSSELITAVDEFYTGMELVNADDVILNDKPGQDNKDIQGWERGYLDGYMEAVQRQKRETLERQKFTSISKQHAISSPAVSMNKDAYTRHHSPGSSSGSRSRSRSLSRSHSRSHSRSRSRSRSRSHSRSRSRNRFRGRSYSYSRSRSRSPSPSRSPDNRHHHHPINNSSKRSKRRSYSRSRSRSPPPQFRGGGRRGSPPLLRGRSPPRGRSPGGRGRRSSPPPHHSVGYNNRSYEQQRRYSRSPSPPPSSFRQPPVPAASTSMNSSTSYSSNHSMYGSSNQFQQSNGGGGGGEGVSEFDKSIPPVVSAENRYLGLGSKSSSTLDEFDSFRKNKSQAFSKREPHIPFTCYRCNKVGHLARECTSL